MDPSKNTTSDAKASLAELRSKQTILLEQLGSIEQFVAALAFEYHQFDQTIKRHHEQLGPRPPLRSLLLVAIWDHIHHSIGQHVKSCHAFMEEKMFTRMQRVREMRGECE